MQENRFERRQRREYHVKYKGQWFYRRLWGFEGFFSAILSLLNIIAHTWYLVAFLVFSCQCCVRRKTRTKPNKNSEVIERDLLPIIEDSDINTKNHNDVNINGML